MPNVLKRLFSGSGGTNSYNAPPKYEYRISIELGNINSIFPHAKGTADGRKERLQVLGLLPHPLDHPDADACFRYVWGHYFKRLVAGSDDPAKIQAVSDPAADIRLDDYLRAYLI